jgi:acetoacetate decarboxylase
MFHPNDKKVTFVPTAHVGSDGKFKVVSDLKPGIPAGNYKVTVIWPDPSKKPSQSQMMTGLFEDAPDMLKGAFASPDKTPLAMEVTSSLKELPVLEIKTQ